MNGKDLINVTERATNLLAGRDRPGTNVVFTRKIAIATGRVEKRAIVGKEHIVIAAPVLAEADDFALIDQVKEADRMVGEVGADRGQGGAVRRKSDLRNDVRLISEAERGVP